MYEELINSFYAAKNEESAEKMAAYMKNKFPYLGIYKPKRAGLESAFLKEARKGGIDWGFVEYLWSLPEREFQYLAMDYLGALKKKLKEEDLPRVTRLIENKQWWDTVDFLAAVLIGEICARYPRLIPEVSSYALSGDIWLKRTAILFQIKYKAKTDAALLGSILEKCGGTKEFFLNKAIGWALREYSKTNPDWVRGYINGHTLHPLSVREGSKYI
jgi:3-methyladenine DNA glycosylase AlkD